MAAKGGGCGCGGCFTAIVLVVILGAIWTYALTGNGRWVTLGLAVGFTAAFITTKVMKRRAATRKKKTEEIAKGAVWAATRIEENDK